MPSVRMYDIDQYTKAIEVLTEVGGSFQGIGFDEKYLVVNETQYAALVAAGVVRDEGKKKGKKSGKTQGKRA